MRELYIHYFCDNEDILIEIEAIVNSIGTDINIII